jgi:hypothetical protein
MCAQNSASSSDEACFFIDEITVRRKLAGLAPGAVR